MRLPLSTAALLLALCGGCAPDPSPPPTADETQEQVPDSAPVQEPLSEEKPVASSRASSPSAPVSQGDWSLHSIGEGIVARDGMAGVADRESEELVIVYTNNVDGEIEPCG